MDDDFIAQVDARLNSGLDAGLLFRYLDPDNFYRARLETAGASNTVYLEKMLKGKLTVLGSTTFTPSTPNVLKVKCSASTLKVWVDGTLKITCTTNSDLAWGGSATFCTPRCRWSAVHRLPRAPAAGYNQAS